MAVGEERWTVKFPLHDGIRRAANTPRKRRTALVSCSVRTWKIDGSKTCDCDDDRGHQEDTNDNIYWK